MTDYLADAPLKAKRGDETLENLQKAKIIVLDENDEEDRKIDVLFNPKEYRINYSSSYKETKIPGSELFITQFSGVEPSELSLSLFFDTGERIGIMDTVPASDVTQKTKDFVKLLYVDASLHRPPHVKFQWGSMNFIGVVLSADTEYTMFDKDGMPTRATVGLKIKETMDISTGSRKTPLESPDRTKCRMASAGKDIWHIAYEEYGSMELWRVIASENNISDPLAVKDGTVLKIPAL